MLAQNFKTPKELQLDDAEFSALVTVLGMLERGELKHRRDRYDDMHIRNRVSPGKRPVLKYFNMNWWLNKLEAEKDGDCGTVCCIGGAASAILGREFNSLSGTQELHWLFHPPIASSWNSITPKKAAQALRNYLTRGDARWYEVMR
jgi:hypothetical protein